MNPPDTQRFIVDVTVRMDRANGGMSLLQIYDLTGSMCPQLKREKCKSAFRHGIRTRFKKELTGIISAQKTTTKRSGIAAG